MKSFVCFVVWVVISNPVVAAILTPNFSVDPASPSFAGDLGPDDILLPGPTVKTHGTVLGLQADYSGGFYDDLDALSYGQDPIQNPLYFSVDRTTVGLTGSDVFELAQAGVADAARHVFVSLPLASNREFLNGSFLGLLPGFPGDDLNGLELDTFAALHTYFSIDQLSASNLIGTFDLANDIFLDILPNVFAIGETDIGLDPMDDLDALVLDDRFQPGVLNPGIDRALFSLSRFSPSTFTTSGNTYDPGVKGSLSPADILFTDFTGTFRLWESAAGFGLDSLDNVDALDTIVPEPASSVIWGIATVGVIIGLCYKRRSSTRRYQALSS